MKTYNQILKRYLVRAGRGVIFALMALMGAATTQATPVVLDRADDQLHATSGGPDASRQSTSSHVFGLVDAREFTPHVQCQDRRVIYFRNQSGGYRMAIGQATNHAALIFKSWQDVIGGEFFPPGPRALIGTNLVLHLKTDDIYLDFVITAWRQGPFTATLSGFSVSYSTPAVATPLSVSITNPADGAVFAAPANLKIDATAVVGGNTVTNVAFFNNAVPLGSVQSSPFTFTHEQSNGGFLSAHGSGDRRRDFRDVRRGKYLGGDAGCRFKLGAGGQQRRVCVLITTPTSG